MSETTTTQDTTPALYIRGTGRRKTSVARVRLKPNGSGQIVLNGKRSLDDYFAREQDRIQSLAPLRLTGTRNKFDVFITVTGGGLAGQAGAIRHGIARALTKADAAYYPALKEAGFLTRDARQVERKKPGRAGARASFQFSKR